jgi:hypothetical protein
VELSAWRLSILHARLNWRERGLMPRETWPRKCRKPAIRPARLSPPIFILMTPDEPTPAMQNPEKDPNEWTTGEEPMTGPQRSYLQTLCREAGEEFNDKLSKAEASKKIEELQAKTGRGKKQGGTAS